MCTLYSHTGPFNLTLSRAPEMMMELQNTGLIKTLIISHLLIITSVHSIASLKYKSKYFSNYCFYRQSREKPFTPMCSVKEELAFTLVRRKVWS